MVNTSRSETQTGATIRIDLSVPEDVSATAIYLPMDAGLSSFLINGQRFESRVIENRANQTINLVGFYTDEIELQLNTDSTEPIDAYLVSQFKQMPSITQRLISARQPSGTAVHQGDQALSFHIITL
ncbi:MAG: hypothetical protein ACI9B8_003446 [Sulfitobacter sp.]